MNVKELKEYLNQCPEDATILIMVKPKELLQLDSISCAITEGVSLVTFCDTRYSKESQEKFSIFVV